MLARVEIWHNSFLAWLDAPILGHGLGSFEQAYNAHRAGHMWLINDSILTLPWNAAGAAHNVFLQSLIEVGLIGTALIWATIFMAVQRTITAVFIIILTMCLLEFPEQNPATALLIVCALGLSCSRKPA